MDDDIDHHRDWLSFRQLDQQQGWRKGEAFRRFKRLAPEWQEQHDFRVLHHQQDRAGIEALRAKNLIYDSTVNLVLVSPSLAAAMVELRPDA